MFLFYLESLPRNIYKTALNLPSLNLIKIEGKNKNKGTNNDFKIPQK